MPREEKTVKTDKGLSHVKVGRHIIKTSHIKVRMCSDEITQVP